MRDQHDNENADLIRAKRGRPCKLPELGPMSDAERARAYRVRKRSRAGLALAQVSRSKADGPNWLRDYTDAQLLEAMRISLANVRVGSKADMKRAGKIAAELARRYPAA